MTLVYLIRCSNTNSCCTSCSSVTPSHKQVNQEINGVNGSQNPIKIVQLASIKIVCEPPILLTARGGSNDVDQGRTQPTSKSNLGQKQSTTNASGPIGGLIVEKLKLSNVRKNLGSSNEKDLRKQPEDTHGGGNGVLKAAFVFDESSESHGDDGDEESHAHSLQRSDSSVVSCVAAKHWDDELLVDWDEDEAVEGAEDSHGRWWDFEVIGSEAAVHDGGLADEECRHLGE